eukprot:TRINITY_DN2960_c0_g1_i1.p1 TRINITY_DN2960_c0_g1~~TRINITY_DN2960_c0_g1_i1.p1  ORF type:complete len:573 (+),score=68.84 TRINITY_DN2960_c0_g1_i1:707-2425(+)
MPLRTHHYVCTTKGTPPTPSMWVEDSAPACTPNGNGSPEPEPFADAPVPTGEVGEMEKLTCPVCLDLFHEPCVLECGHAVCRGCAESGDGGCFVCPVCRKVYHDIAPSLLPIHPSIQRAVHDISAAEDVEPSTCEKCELSPASFGCEQCDLVLCPVCNSEHHKGKLKTHTVVDVASYSSSQSTPFCQKEGHGRYRTDLVNVETGELVCLLCFQVDPGLKNKKCAPVGEALARAKRSLTEFIGRAEAAKSSLKSNVVNIDKIMGGISDLYTDEIAKLRSEFQRLREEIDRRELHLIEQASRSKEKQTIHLNDVRARSTYGVAMVNVEISKAAKALQQGRLDEIKTVLAEGKKAVEGSQIGLKMPHFSRPVLRINKSALASIKTFAGFEYETTASESGSEPVSVSPRSNATPRSKTPVAASPPTLTSEESDTVSPSHRRKTTPVRKPVTPPPSTRKASIQTPTPRRTSTPPRSGIPTRRVLSKERLPRQTGVRNNTTQTPQPRSHSQERDSHDRELSRRGTTDAATITPERNGHCNGAYHGGNQNNLYSQQYQQRHAYLKARKEVDPREDGWKR